MSNNDFIPNDEQLWDSVLANQTDDNELINQQNQSDSRNETPLLERFQLSSSGIMPGLDLDPDTGILTIEVTSVSQCSFNFFGPVLFWLRHYCTQPQPKTIFHLHSKDQDPFDCIYLSRVLLLLEGLQDKGNQVELHWHYPEGDQTSVAAVRKFNRNCPLPLMVHRKQKF
ncbi:MAG: hypothetical protein ACI9FU_002492 [Granulosicoccus sp.]|jgi:hypothetical protein